METQNYLSVYAKSFNWAGFFLPKNILIKCSVLYDFCRTLDNIADQNNCLEKKKEDFIKFKKEFSSKIKNNIILKVLLKKEVFLLNNFLLDSSNSIVI